MKNENIILQQFLILSPFLLYCIFICACKPAAPPHQPLPEDRRGIIEEDDILEAVSPKKKRRRRRRSYGGGGSSSSSSDNNVDNSSSEVTQVDISQLRQISNLMARGEYERASELSKGVSPQLSALIDAGDYAGASLLLSQMLAYVR